MKFTVVWQPMAMEQLTSIWVNIEDRQAVAAAADSIDQQLRTNPVHFGESRSDAIRVAIILPLAVHFEVVPDDRLVRVLAMRTILPPQSPADE